MMQECEQQGQDLQADDNQDQLLEQQPESAVVEPQQQLTKVTHSDTCMFACKSAAQQ